MILAAISKREDLRQKLSASLMALLALLLNGGYYDRNDAVCIDLFTKYYYSYYEDALNTCPPITEPIKLIKFIIKTTLLKNSFKHKKNLLLLHNIRIDTHRYVVQRALSLLYEK